MRKALIFANGDVNDGDMVRRTLEVAAAMPGQTLIIAADGGARAAQYFGLRPDTVIGDMDSLSEIEQVQLQAEGTDIIRHPAEKDETDLELAIALARDEGATWIRVIGGVGDRLDQTISNVYLLAQAALAGFDARMVAGKQEAWVIGSGDHTIVGAEGDTVSLIPLNGAAHGIVTEGLYYPLRDEDLYFGPARGVSNVMTAPHAQIRIRDGALLVVHTLGRA
jgi:thiamine pyrophosphokinase